MKKLIVVIAVSLLAYSTIYGDEPQKNGVGNNKEKHLGLEKDKHLGEKRDKNIDKQEILERIKALKETNPEKYNALMGKLRERLKNLKEQNPEKFRALLENRKNKLMELKKIILRNLMK